MLFITVRCLAMTSTKDVSLGADDAVLSGQPAEDVGVAPRGEREQSLRVVLLSVTYATDDILFFIISLNDSLLYVFSYRPYIISEHLGFNPPMKSKILSITSVLATY